MVRASPAVFLLFFALTRLAGPALARPEPASSGEPPQLKQLPRRILRDQKFLWLRAFRLRRTDLPPTSALLATTASLIGLDRPVAQELSDSPPGAGYKFSRRVGQLGGGVPVASLAGTFYLVGRGRGDERSRAAGLLGLEALADAVVIVQLLKTATQRPRPTHPGGRVRIHNADGEFFSGGRSFPSGHAAQAWAFATVVAHEYRHRRWVPPASYALAGLVAVARVTERRHFPSDAFVGSALGYLIGRHVCHAYAQETSARGTGTRRRAPQIALEVPAGGGAAVVLHWVF